MEEILIEAIRARSILYDPSHRNYMNIKVKSKHWDEIAIQAGLTSGIAAKSLWEKLRHGYRDALRRQERMRRMGVSAESIRPWKHQRRMDFLQSFFAAKKKEGSSQNDSDSEDAQFISIGFEENASYQNQQTRESMSDNDDSHTFPLSNLNIASTSSINTADQVPSVSAVHSALLENQDNATQRQKTTSVASLLKKNLEVRQQMLALQTTERRQRLEELRTPDDPLYHFFMAMYQTTKRMPLPSQLAIKNQIYQVVSNMEANLLGQSDDPLRKSQASESPCDAN